MHTNLLLALSLLLCSFLCFGQDDSINQYIPENFVTIKEYLKQINKNQLNRVEGSYTSKIKKIYADTDERMIAAIEDSVYYFNPVLKKHLDNILFNVYSASNAYISNEDFHFFIKNSVTPNAGCYGDGRYELNLGLLTTYDTDDELAFVICHEIAHDILDHSYNKISTVVAELNSASTKKRIKEIKRNEYGQTRASLALMDELNTEFLKHSKEVESQADSLGFVLYQKTRYNPSMAISALEKLKINDNVYFDFPIKLDSVFSFENYTFKKYWLEEELSLFDTDEKLDDFVMSSDKEETHPEIDFRIEKLKNNFTISDQLKTEPSNMIRLSEIAAAQSVKYTIDLNLLDLAMYQLIKKFELGEINQDFYYVSMAAVLVKIYEAKKNHELGKFVSRKNNFSSEAELNKIRLFLHNLELNELRKIGLMFCEKNIVKTKNKNFLNQSITLFKPKS